MFTAAARLRVKIKELEFEADVVEKKRAHERVELQQEFVLKENVLRQEIELEKTRNKEETKNLEAKLVLKHEQEVADLTLEFEKKTNALELKANEKIVEEKEKLNADFYKRMTDGLQTIHEKGNHTTDFLKDITMKMLDKNSIMRIDNNSKVPHTQVDVTKVD